MVDSTKHHVWHPLKLIFNRTADVRMIVTVTGRPPGCHAVDQSRAVGENQVNTFGSHNGYRPRRGLHLAVRHPDEGSTIMLPRGNRTGEHPRLAGHSESRRNDCGRPAVGRRSRKLHSDFESVVRLPICERSSVISRCCRSAMRHISATMFASVFTLWSLAIKETAFCRRR